MQPIKAYIKKSDMLSVSILANIGIFSYNFYAVCVVLLFLNYQSTTIIMNHGFEVLFLIYLWIIISFLCQYEIVSGINCHACDNSIDK